MGAGGDDVTALAFSPDGKYLAIGTAYEVPSGKLLATFLAFASNEWTIYTPNGFYTGSPDVE